MTQAVNPYGQAAVRTGVVAFLAGRGFSALLTFVAFALAARLLDLPAYGIYAAALALMEIGLALSSAGVDWVAARSLPEYRLHAGGRATVALILRLAALQSLILIIAGGLVAALAAPLSRLMQLEGAAEPFVLVGVLLAVEGIGRLSRDQMLGILMRQRSGQIAQVIRAGTLAAQLAWALHTHATLGADDVLRCELIAAGSAALAGAALLAHALWRLWPLPPGDPAWRAPSRRKLWALALHTYTSYLLALAYGPQVLTMLIARLLGVEAAGVFGFARGFADQVRRYLPTDLLQSVLRPALVAYYTAEGNFAGLMLRLGLWLKSSLMVLLPLLAFFAVFGDMGVTALGGVRFLSAWPIVLILLCGAGMMAWRRVAELACNTVMAPEICVRAGLLLLLIPPLMLGVLYVTGSLLVAVGLFVAAEAGFCLRVLQLLRQRGFTYVWSQGGFMRLLGALLLTVALLVLVRGMFSPPLIGAAATTLVLSLLATGLARPLGADESVLVSSWSPRLARLMCYRVGVPR